MSVSSATKSFLEEAKDDLQEFGLGTKKIRENSIGSAFSLRVQPSSLETFAKEVGFSHPRKKRILLEKLRKGARNYVYDGRKERNILDDEFYDLTAMDRLRVIGLGDFLLDAREENSLYQRELAEKVGASKNQVYCWENDKCAMPVEVLVKIMGVKSDVLDVFSREQPKFKVGVRGRDCSLVDLPLRPGSEVDRIASNAVAAKREMRIRRQNEDIADELEQVFGTDIIQSENKFYTKHRTVIDFFKTFYSYRPKFQEHDEDEIQQLENQLEIPS